MNFVIDWSTALRQFGITSARCHRYTAATRRHVTRTWPPSLRRW